MESKERTTFYIDGFNFYYGLKRAIKSKSWSNYCWLDVVKFCKSFLEDTQELSKAIYFTATPSDAEKSSRQSAFLNANRMLNKDVFEIVRGKYITKEIHCPCCNQTFLRPEEKKTDVNISIRMIKDCIQNKVDKIILVSADTDLIPPTNFSHDIKKCISQWNEKPVLLERNERRFKDALMSDLVCGKYSIPQKWKR